MTECAWWTSIFSRVAVPRLMFGAEGVDSDRAALRHLVDEVIKPLRRGDPLENVALPARYIAAKKTSRRPVAGRRLPHFLFTSDLPFVSDFVADILSAHDTGAMRLVPAKFMEYGGTDEIDEAMHLLIPGNAKTCIIGYSDAALQSAGRGPKAGKIIFAKQTYSDDDIRLGKTATGGPEVWVDPGLLGGLFVSDAVKVRLDAAGTGGEFHWKRAPVVAE